LIFLLTHLLPVIDSNEFQDANYFSITLYNGAFVGEGADCFCVFFVISSQVAP